MHRMRIALNIASLVCAALVHNAAAQQSLDILIRNGQLIDGTGSTGRPADVGIRADRIVFVGDAVKSNIRATRTIDARGLIVSPGLIDPHAHVMEDLSDPRHRSNENYLRQGVTTVLTGNDGYGPFDVRAALNQWDSSGIGTNAGLLVGYGSVRKELLASSSRAPTPAELDRMRGLVKKAMDEGAFGFSTGLFYTPQNFEPRKKSSPSPKSPPQTAASMIPTSAMKVPTPSALWEPLRK